MEHKAHKEAMKGIGEERTLLRAHNNKKEKEMDCPHPGRRLTTKISYRQKMMRYWMVAVSFIVYGKPKDEAQQ